MKLIHQYPGLVERFYTMKKEHEYLERDGENLKNGMVVLLAQDLLRWPLENRQESDFQNFDEVLKTNRWCTISEISFNGYMVTFVGIYQDGRTFRRTFPKDVAWLVKKNPVIDNPKVIANQLRQNIHDEVLKVLKKQRDGNDAILVLSHEASVEIMKLLR